MGMIAALKKLSWLINRIPLFNSVSGRRKNKITIEGLLLRSKIRVVGQGNTVVIKKGALLYKSGIQIVGNHNRIEIGEDAHIKYASFNFEEDGNAITVGRNTAMCGRINLAALEGTAISIGEDCLFSAGIEIRTSDSHSILNAEGERINAAESITLSDRVWCGQGVYILKGAAVGPDSVIGAASVVTKPFCEPNCILAGIPARVVKREITWDRKRLKKQNEEKE